MKIRLEDAKMCTFILSSAYLSPAAHSPGESQRWCCYHLAGCRGYRCSWTHSITTVFALERSEGGITVQVIKDLPR